MPSTIPIESSCLCIRHIAFSRETLGGKGVRSLTDRHSAFAISLLCLINKFMPDETQSLNQVIKYYFLINAWLWVQFAPPTIVAKSTNPQLDCGLLLLQIFIKCVVPIQFFSFLFFFYCSRSSWSLTDLKFQISNMLYLGFLMGLPPTEVLALHYFTVTNVATYQLMDTWPRFYPYSFSPFLV